MGYRKHGAGEEEDYESRQVSVHGDAVEYEIDEVGAEVHRSVVD